MLSSSPCLRVKELRKEEGQVEWEEESEYQEEEIGREKSEP
jgi:hypothetical protein